MGDRAAAIKFYNQGVSAANNKADPKHLQMAYSLWAAACAADPTFPEAFYQAGCANSDMNLLPAAVAAWRRAIECDIKDPVLRSKALANLAWRIHSLGRYDEALPLAQEAVSLVPDAPVGHLNLSVIYQGFNQLPAAIKHAERAFELEPTTPLHETNLAFCHLFDGNWAAGFKHFEARFASHFTQYLQLPYERWTGEPGKVVFVSSDQGLGDTLSFARFVPAAAKRAAYLHLAVHPELMRAYQHAFIGLPNVNIIPKDTNFPQADYWTTFVSLPFALGLTNEEFESAPTPDFPVFTMAAPWKVPERKLHIGIAWAGSPLNQIDQFRNIPLDMFAELYRVPGIQLYSLQVGPRAQDMHQQGYAPVMVDLSHYIRDIVDTWSLLQHLDLVICCESAVGHIAGAVGKETWIPYSYQGKDWRLGLRGDRRLWYPKHRTFPQSKNMRWQPVFEDIIKALEKRV